MTVFIFNPEHDLALAYNKPNYIPSASIRQMRSDLALLPMWFADSGDGILAASAYNDHFLTGMCGKFQMERRLVVPNELRELSGCTVIPWGWNESIRRELQTLGLPETALCPADYPQILRTCSHRAQAVQLLQELLPAPDFCGFSTLLESEADCRHFVESYPYALLKAPLSGSGKGLNWCKGTYTPHISNWCKRILQTQSAVVGEPLYNKVVDFAIEFYIGEQTCSFAGYSFFSTSQSGSYDASLLASNQEIESRITAYVPQTALNKLQEQLRLKLQQMYGSVYRGYLGVDMMVCLEENGYKIHPCVEINLRMNMGVVARLFYDRFCESSSRGEYHISYHPAQDEAWTEHQKMEKEHPLCIENGRIRSGYMPLTPVQHNTRYRAWVNLEGR